MPLRIGDATPSRLYVGDTALSRLYVGDNLVWSSMVNDGDNFNRASLGPDWTLKGFNSASIVPVINGNRLRNGPTSTANTSNQSAGLFTRTAASTDDHMVRALLATAVNGFYSGLIMRASIDFQYMVLAMLTSDANNTGIWTVIGGTFTRRTTSATSSLAVGDTVGFRADENVYTLVRNPDAANTTLSTWTDSGNLYVPGATRRFGGLYVQSNANFAGTQSWSAEFDDFNIRDI